MEASRRTLRLPPGLAEQAEALAAVQGLSLNAFIVQAVRNWADYQARKLGQPVPAAVTRVRTPAAPVETRLTGLPKVGANEPCPCGSGQKYKRCHGRPGAA